MRRAASTSTLARVPDARCASRRAATSCPRSRRRTPIGSPTRRWPNVTRTVKEYTTWPRSNPSASSASGPLLRARPRAQPALLHEARLRRVGAAARARESGRQKSAVFQAGDVVRDRARRRSGEGGRAARFLSKHPDGVGTLDFEVEDIEQTFRCSSSAAARRSPTSRRSRTPRRQAAPVLDHHAVRRHHVPLPPAPRLQGVFPGHRAATRRRAAATNKFGFSRDRSRHLELPDDEADAAVAGARDGLRAALGGRVPHRATSRSTSARTARACGRW